MADEPRPQEPKTAEQRRADLVNEFEVVEEGYNPSPEPKQPPAGVPVPEAGAITPPPPQPTHSPHVVRMAETLGFSGDEIKSYSRDQLESAVYHAQRALMSERQARLADVGRQPQQNAPPPEEFGFDFGDIEDYDLDGQPLKDSAGQPRRRRATEADVHPAILNVFKQQAREIKALKDQLSGFHAREARRDEEAVENRVDQFFTSHDEGLFGKGAISAMQQESEQYARRLAVYNEAKRLAAIQSRGQPSLQGVLANLGKAASTLGFAKTEQQPEPPKRHVPPKDPVNGRFTAEQWASAGLARPTHRANAEEPKGVARATRVLREKMQDAAQDDSALSKELEGELPG